jgi:drug/metabolite transporter (DMT)-like permease
MTLTLLARDEAHDRAAVAALLVSGVLWGLTWIAFRHFATLGLAGVTFTAATYGLLGAAMLPFVWRQRRVWRHQTGLLVAVGLLGGAANACFVTALTYGEVMRMMLLFYLAPVWSVLGGRLVLGETISPPRALAVGTALLGALLLMGGPRVLVVPPGWQDLLAIGSGVFYAGQNIASRRATDVPVGTKSAAIFAGCGAVSVLLLPVAGTAFPAVTTTLVLQLAAFAVIWMGAANWTTMYGVTHLEAGRAGVLLVFELVAAVVSAMLIGGENLDPWGWAGCGLITGAALLEARTSSSSGASQR